MKKIAKSKSGVYGVAAISLISGVRSLIIGDENGFFWMVCFIFVLSLIDLMRAKDKMTSGAIIAGAGAGLRKGGQLISARKNEKE